MSFQVITDKLTKFRLVDKFQAFHEAMPETQFTSAPDRIILEDLLNTCSRDLCRLFDNATKRPTKTAIKKILFRCMDELALAPIDGATRELGYQLGWFLAEITGVDLRKGSARKAWGYWQIENPNLVKSVGLPRRKKLDNAAGTGQEIIIYPLEARK